MADTYGYEETDAIQAVIQSEADHQNPISQCPTTVHETVCVQAEVTITPDVKVGDINFFCVDGSIIGRCRGKLSPKKACTFVVNQKICVEIPLMFSATTIAVPNGIVCDTPETGKCKKKKCCKHKISFIGTIVGLFFWHCLVRLRISVMKLKRLKTKCQFVLQDCHIALKKCSISSY